MITLSNLQNTSRPKKKIQRVGRGQASNRGKTCGRGNKGDKARQGYKQRYGEEGGQKPLYRRLPTRGFNHERHRKENFEVTFSMINALFNDGDVVNRETMKQKKHDVRSLKILATGELKKKVTIEANAFSKNAQKHLEDNSIPFKLVK
jgi:large subunit ribosomal protein L15